MSKHMGNNHVGLWGIFEKKQRFRKCWKQIEAKKISSSCGKEVKISQIKSVSLLSKSLHRLISISQGVKRHAAATFYDIKIFESISCVCVFLFWHFLLQIFVLQFGPADADAAKTKVSANADEVSCELTWPHQPSTCIIHALMVTCTHGVRKWITPWCVTRHTFYFNGLRKSQFLQWNQLVFSRMPIILFFTQKYLLHVNKCRRGGLWTDMTPHQRLKVPNTCWAFFLIKLFRIKQFYVLSIA